MLLVPLFPEAWSLLKRWKSISQFWVCGGNLEGCPKDFGSALIIEDLWSARVAKNLGHARIARNLGHVWTTEDLGSICFARIGTQRNHQGYIPVRFCWFNLVAWTSTWAQTSPKGLPRSWRSFWLVWHHVSCLEKLSWMRSFQQNCIFDSSRQARTHFALGIPKLRWGCSREVEGREGMLKGRLGGWFWECLGVGHDSVETMIYAPDRESLCVRKM